MMAESGDEGRQFSIGRDVRTWRSCCPGGLTAAVKANTRCSAFHLLLSCCPAYPCSAKTEQYSELIRAGDADGIMDLLTDKWVGRRQGAG